MKNFLLSLPLVAFALLGTVALASPPGPGYHLIKKVSLGAAPGGGEYFDYVTVDSAARRVYLSHHFRLEALPWCRRASGAWERIYYGWRCRNRGGIRS